MSVDSVGFGSQDCGKECIKSGKKIHIDIGSPIRIELDLEILANNLSIVTN